MRTTIIATAIVAIAFTAAPVLAGSPQAPLAHVAYADLDLAKPADIARLNRRIAASLETVCGSYSGARQEEVDEIKSCRASAMAQSKAAVAALLKDRSTRLAAR